MSDRDYRRNRIATLDQLNRGGSSGEESEDDSGTHRAHLPDQQYYVGGSERSGQLTVDPLNHPSAPNRANIFDRIVNAAERTADTEFEQRPVPTLHLWRNGFSIDDGPLRPTDDEENRRVLEDLMMNRLPSELHGIAGIRIDDRRQDEFPKQPMKAFSGRGRVLGSPTPQMRDEPRPTLEAAEPPAAPIVTPELPKLDVRRNEPTSTVAVRFPNGQRVQIEVNQNRHTLIDIRTHVVLVQNDLAFQQFDLFAGVPVPVKITDESKTIAENNLCNCLILVKVVNF